ncbi:hypothetical protein KI387_021104 [Taxus chinensis]|uniref:Uncharacterized protein n=1 Tax=Taxus chinensis TaxID=29808 RepID=A0AA38GD62_TAXCH|nr:hypothetical protein KI387_021104 [Taxus chinensis]
MKSWVAKEMRNGKKATSGSLYEEEHVQYPFNPTSQINGKGGARRLDLDGDRSFLAHAEEGVFIRPEERVSLFEGEKALARGMPREKSRVAQEDHRSISFDPWKEGLTKTPFPYPLSANPANLGQPLQTLNLEQAGNSGKEVNGQGVWKELVSTKERSDKEHGLFQMLKAQENTEQEKLENLGITVTPEKPLEELPRLPPVRLKSEEKNLNFSQEDFQRGDKLDSTGSSTKATNMEGSFLDVPVGQEIINSAGKRMMGSSQLSISQGIAEDDSELIPGHATIGDGLSESVDYPNEYWDSDEYEDDEDLGYISNTGNSQSGHSSCEDQDIVKHVVKGRDAESGGVEFGGFSFPSPSSTNDMAGSKAESGKSLWSTKGNMTVYEDADDYGNDVIEGDDILASWRHKSNESSPVLGSRDEKQVNVKSSAHSTTSTYSNYELAERELQKRDTEENLNDPREHEEVGA